MKRASIDIGSNSILLLAAEFNVTANAIEREYLNESYITSLGKDLDKTKRFHPDSMQASLEALSDCKKLLVSIGIKAEDVIVTATEASRVAKNAREYFEKINNDLGFSVTIINSEGEAYYTALGVVSSLDQENDKENGNKVIMDIGGASTELIAISTNHFKINQTISLPVGSVRGTDWRLEGFFDEKMKNILDKDFRAYQTKTLICVAGSMTALASMYLGLKEFEASKIDGMAVSYKSFSEFTSELQKTNVENLLLLFPFLGKRAPMVSAGAKIADLIAEKLNIETIKISTRGLRYGVLIKGEIDDCFKA